MKNPIMEGLEVTVIGISTVFFVLLILMVVLYIMRFIFYRETKKVNKEIIADNIQSAQKVKEDIADDEELIAVLTAAVAASLNQSTYNLKIKSFRRIENRAPVWNKVSRSEQIANKL